MFIRNCSNKYGGIIERYLSTCGQPPIMLVFDFSAGVIYHGNQCSEQLSPSEVENINQFKNGKLSPVGEQYVRVYLDTTNY